jgi:hypothetical protein
MKKVKIKSSSKIFAIICFLLIFHSTDSCSKFLPTINEFIDFSGSCNPDLPCFSYSYVNQRFHGTMGNYIPIVGVQSNNIDYVITLVPLIELHNFSSKYPICWQLWRGVVGIEGYWKLKKIFNSDKVAIALGFIHESDHFSDPDYFDNYIKYGQLSYNYGYKQIHNQDLSSFEYIDTKFIYSGLVSSDKIRTIAIVGGKYFTRDPVRLQKYAYNVELICNLSISSSLSIFGSGYFENIINDFSSEQYGFIINSDKEPLVYQIVNIGVDFSNNGMHFQIYKTISNSNGKGIDFIEKSYSDGFGIRFIKRI